MLRKYSFSSPTSSRCSASSIALIHHSLRFFATADPVKQRRFRKLCGFGSFGSPMRGRTQDSYNFEKRIKLVGSDSVRQHIAWPMQQKRQEAKSSTGTFFDPNTTVVADFVSFDEIREMHRIARPHPMPLFSLLVNDESSLAFDYTLRRRLQKEGDAASVTLPLLPQQRQQQQQTSTAASTAPPNSTTAKVILVVEPDVRGPEYQQSEAQIELITAFRNVLMEFFELNCPASIDRALLDAAYETEPPKYTTLRIPAMSHELHGGKFDLSMDKIHQRALIQAFHRTTREAKDWFAHHMERLSVELFVPLPLLQGFERAFSDEAWPTPKSALIPERRKFYEELQMPANLLEEAPGFIGERDEIRALALPYEERQKVLGELEKQRRLEQLAPRGDGEEESAGVLRIEMNKDDVTIGETRKISSGDDAILS